MCLLASDTNECKVCARIIAAIININPWNEWYKVCFNEKKDFGKDVNSDDGASFAGQGMHNWMKKIQDLISFLEKEDCDRIYLNVTGGYKGTVPYSTLMGMLYKNVRLAYLFEESSSIINIPSYPVGLDFHQWHENALRLRMSAESCGSKYFTPDLPVNNLLDKGQLSPFGQALEEKYNEQVDVDPLKVYSKNIIDRLLSDKGPSVDNKQSGKESGNTWSEKEQKIIDSLRTVLHDLIDKVGDIIWLGDKIPEMVEHAQRHHHNLLEFTELFLTPILHENKDFLNAYERFVLLSAVMLHDCGHSLDRISFQACVDLDRLFGEVIDNKLGKEFILFPSDVRNYHHYLTGIRLNDHQTTSDLNWPGAEGFKRKNLPGYLHDAVILACLYHRQRMDYDQVNSEKDCKLYFTGQYPGALESHNINNVDLMKIVALLRLIDGCDSQARRTGSPLRIDLTVALLEKDYYTASIKAEQSYQSFVNCIDSNKKQWKDALIKPNGSNESWRLADKKHQVRFECLKILNNNNSKPEALQCARLWLMAAEAADRAQICYKQFPHFMKHRAIQEIQVLPEYDFNKNNFAFNIILFPDDSSEIICDPYEPGKKGDISFWLQQKLFSDDENNEEMLYKTIEREVSSEYSGVADYVNKNYNISATYWWQEEWEKQKKNNQGKPFFRYDST